MLKKLIAMTIVTTMLLSSFCIIAQAEYGYNWGEQIAKKTYSSTNNDKTTGDEVTSKNAYLRGSYVENGAAKYNLYNGTTQLTGAEDFIRFNQAYSYGTFVDMKNNMFKIDTRDRAGKSFYSKSTDMRGSLEIVARDNIFPANKLSTTMTYTVDVTYTDGFADTLFVIGGNSTTAPMKRNLNVLKINSNGKLMSGGNSFTEEIGELNLNTDYKIGIVMKFIPTTTSGKYTFEKTIYVNDSKIKSYKHNAEVDFRGTFYRFDIDYIPWTSEPFTNSEALGDADFWYYNSTTTSGAPKNITTKYTIIPACTIFNNFTVSAGDLYAQNQPSLSNADSDFYITSNVRENTNYVTVAAQTAADDATANGTIVLATYNTSGELESIKTAPLTLTQGAITEQDIDISTANADETKLFIINSTSAMTPLAQSTDLN